MNDLPVSNFKYLSICAFLILGSHVESGCTLQIQEAAGCNNPGLFGCKDKPEITESARDTSVLNPADDRDTENKNQDTDE